MINKKSIILLLIFFIGTNCGLINKNINARKNIKHCKFEFVRFNSINIEYQPKIEINFKKIDIDDDKCVMEEIIKNLSDIRLKKFKNFLSSLEFKVEIKIINPNNNEVVLDELSADIYIDENYVTRVEHKEFIRIGAEGLQNTTLGIILKNEMEKISLSSAKRIIIKSEVKARILIGEHNIKFPIPIKIECDYPREKIIEMIENNKEKLAKKLIGRAEIYLKKADKEIERATEKLNKNGIDINPVKNRLKNKIDEESSKLLDKLFDKK